MSIDVMNNVWKHSESSGNTLLVLLKMADHADDEGVCWPGVNSLARAARVHRSTVQRHITKLIQSGEVIVLEEGGKGARNTSKYQILVQPFVGWQSATLEDAEGSGGATHKSSGGAPKGSGGATQTTSNHQSNHQTTPMAPAVDPLESDFEFWLEHHTTITGSKAPRPGTAARQEVRAMYRSRRKEKYTAEDLMAAVVGAYQDDYRRQHGYFDHVSVLRPTKVHSLIAKGNRHRGQGANTMADREHHVKALSVGSEASTAHSVVVSHVRTILFPPPPGDIDPFTQQPTQTADEARAALVELGLEVPATVDEHRDEATAIHNRINRRK